jgi:competence protein ComEA
MHTLNWVVAAAAAIVLAIPVSIQAQDKPGSAKVASTVNLNTATVAELETLPGIGRSTAERIVEYRQKNGGFKKIEELMNVRGIGEKSFLKLKPMIVITSKTDKPVGQW